MIPLRGSRCGLRGAVLFCAAMLVGTTYADRGPIPLPQKTRPETTRPENSTCPLCSKGGMPGWIVDDKGNTKRCPQCNPKTSRDSVTPLADVPPDGDLSEPAIAFVKSVRVEEPTQHAVVAWNGKEELLVLSTQVKPSKSVRLLEILPLPSEPEVFAADPKTFEVLHDELTGGLIPSAAEKLFEKRIGPHHLFAIRVDNQADFVAWVQGYLVKYAGVRTLISERALAMVQSYIDNGYRYFVLDLIDADAAGTRQMAIAYRFKTDHLFYPFRITAISGQGETYARLLILSNGLLRYNTRLLPSKYIDVRPFGPNSKAAKLSRERLSELSPLVADLFGDTDEVLLRRWDVFGPIREIPGDLKAWSP